MLFYEIFMQKGNYDGNISPLDVGLNKCVENNNNISIFITDFLDYIF